MPDALRNALFVMGRWIGVEGRFWANNSPILFVKVGSFHRGRQNFRLTQEVKETFTEKLRSDRSEWKQPDGRTDSIKQVPEDGL